MIASQRKRTKQNGLFGRCSCFFAACYLPLCISFSVIDLANDNNGRTIISPKEKACTPETMNDVKQFRSYGRKLRITIRLVFYIPLLIVFGIGLYLFYSGKPAWLAFVIGAVGLLCFSLARVLTEKKLLAAFNCPDCRAQIGHWERDEQYRVYYDCDHCRVRWDIGYVFGTGPYDV